ncbi:MAG: flap endonuclease-1 [Nitrososphaeria archaeon]
MGVDIKEIVEAKKISLNDLQGKVLAIDAYNALYQFLSTIRGRFGEPLKDSKGNVTSHLSGLYYRTINLLTLGIQPVYVFDGIPPKMKSLEIIKRKEIKEEAEIKYKVALSKGDLKEAKKYAQYTAHLSGDMVEEAKKLLDIMGVPWIQAPSEGEATASYLSSSGKAYAVVSQDYDALLFGGKRLCRNITISGRRKLPGRNVYQEIEPEEILLDVVLNKLGITREQLVDIGILVGTDFNPDGFKGFGPIKALKAVKQYGGLENIPNIDNELKKIDYKSIRKIFLEPEVKKEFKLEFKTVDEDSLLNFMCEVHDFSEERVLKVLIKYKESTKEKRGKGTILDQWFQ